MRGKPFEVVAEFKKCPVCGSNRGFMKKLAKEVKKKGWMREDMAWWLQILEGVVIEMTPAMETKIPMGSVLPAYKVCLEVCLGCGCIYAGKIMRGEAVKGLRPPTKKGILPPDFPPGLVFGKG